MELQVLQARLGFTAIYVTHDQAEAFALAETVVVMNRGKIETVGHRAKYSIAPQRRLSRAFSASTSLRGRVVGHNAETAGIRASPAPCGLRSARV